MNKPLLTDEQETQLLINLLCEEDELISKRLLDLHYQSQSHTYAQDIETK